MTDQRPLPRVPIVVECRGTKAMSVNLGWVEDDTMLRLVREPDNQYDPNAISIEGYRDALGGESRWEQLGYVPREVAVRLAQNMDAEEAWEARVYLVLQYEGVNSGLRVQVYPEGTEHLPDQGRRDRLYEAQQRQRRYDEDWGYGGGYGDY